MIPTWECLQNHFRIDIRWSVRRLPKKILDSKKQFQLLKGYAWWLHITSSFRNQYFHCYLFTISRWFDYSSSWLICVAWCFSKFGHILSWFAHFSRFNCWRAMSCFWFDFYVIVHIIVISVLKKSESIFMRWHLFLGITLSLSFNNM